MALKAILFDLGGTLLHYHDPQEDDPTKPFRRVTLLGIDAMLERLMADPSASNSSVRVAREKIRDAISRQIGRTYQQMEARQRGGNIDEPVRAALSKMGIELSETRWEELRRLLYCPVEAIVSPRQGARATLAALRDAGYWLALISNTFWAAEMHDRHLAEHGLLDLLPVRIYSCNMPYQKPHPSIFLSALDTIGIHAAEAAYVGDRLDIDVEGAQNVGMQGILIRSPYQRASLNGWRPDAVIDELKGLIPILPSLQSSNLYSKEEKRG